MKKKIIISIVSFIILTTIGILYFWPVKKREADYSSRMQCYLNIRNMKALLADYDSMNSFPDSLEKLNNKNLKISDINTIQETILNLFTTLKNTSPQEEYDSMLLIDKIILEEEIN